jgi:predicted 3-demethylubiquinone-9 3-methyltransferase (glyoxalase superfamily)
MSLSSTEREAMSAIGLTTCLWFDGVAEEAADFYASVFTDLKIGKITRYSEAGPGPAGSAMAVEFELNGQQFLGLNGGPEYSFTPAISFQVLCDDQAQVDYYWDRLTDGGTEVMCGWLTDRFGISWQVVPRALIEMMSDPDPQKAARTAQAMFGMTKLDIAALRRSFENE